MKSFLVIRNYEKFVEKMKKITIDTVENFEEKLNNDLSGLFSRNLNLSLPKEEIKNMVSKSEIRSIIKDYIKPVDGKILINKKDLLKCTESLKERFASNVVAYLVKNNYVDQGYDFDHNNFYFE